MAEIETKQLNKFYGKTHALKDVNLEINENELFGLLGVNGAGKTTLIKILTCLSQQTSGEAYVHGFPLRITPKKLKKSLTFPRRKRLLRITSRCAKISISSLLFTIPATKHISRPS